MGRIREVEEYFLFGDRIEGDKDGYFFCWIK